MDISRGCVLIARSLDESDIFQNEKWLKVWIWCLIQANHKGKNVPVNIGRAKTSVWVDRGQFIFGRNKAAEKLGMKPSTVRNIMEKLDDLGNLDIKPDNHCSIVTICDYDFYQTFENYKGQPEDSRRTAVGQPMDTTNTPKTPISPKKKNTYSNEFEDCWKITPKRNGQKQGKFPASELFERLSIEDKRKVYVGLGNYAIYLKTVDHGAMDLERFIRKRFFEDYQTKPNDSDPNKRKRIEEEVKRLNMERDL